MRVARRTRPRSLSEEGVLALYRAALEQVSRDGADRPRVSMSLEKGPWEIAARPIDELRLGFFARHKDWPPVQIELAFDAPVPHAEERRKLWARRQTKNMKQFLEARNARDEPLRVAAGLRLLVVDDEPIILSSMKRLLRRHRVTVVSDPVEGLALALTRPYEGILLDHQMPGMDGTQFVARVMARSPGLVARIAMITAADSISHQVVPVWFKPLRPADIDRILEKFEAWAVPTA